MNSQASPDEPDWSLLRAFLAVAQAGSLSRAAVALGTSQPTLSRQVAALEAQLGQPVFERSSRGVRLTEAGQALRVPAEHMREQAREFARIAAGRATTMAGTVRLTASETMCAYVLPPVLRGLREAHPEIQIELVASNVVENLIERDADIALRMVRPAQSALVARRLADQPLAVYAHRDYVARHGRPTAATLAEHSWIGLDRSDQLIRGFADAGFRVPREFFAFRCDSLIVGWQAVLAGVGIGIGMQRVAALSRELVEVVPEVRVPPLPLWITAHRELRGTPRIRAVFDALAKAFARR
jgi:DNA-binding transcriptional LysR family regulator